MISGEVRNPGRNLPISLIAGVAIVGALYVLTNAAVQYVLPAAAIAATERPASDAIGLVLGWRGAWLVSAGMALSILVAMNGTIMSAGRVPWAVARDRYFFSALAEVHPRFHSPATALWAQAAFAIGFCSSAAITSNFSRSQFSRNGFSTCWPPAPCSSFAAASPTPIGLTVFSAIPGFLGCLSWQQGSCFTTPSPIIL